MATNPSQRALRSLLPKVGYELDMLVASASLEALVGRPSLLHNAVLESFLLHFRNLLEFFYFPKDVSAANFIPGQWSPMETDESLIFGEPRGPLYGDLSHKLSHITPKRRTKRDWDIAQLADGMLNVVGAWSEALPDEHLAALREKTNRRFWPDI